MSSRPWIERVFQAAMLETACLGVVVPIYAAVTGYRAAEAFEVMVVLTLVTLIWSPLHNLTWDRMEHRSTGRIATSRPTLVRVAHAVSHELSPLVVTAPLLVVLGGHTLPEALVLNLGLTLVYILGTFGFYAAYDRLRPLPPCAGERSATRDVRPLASGGCAPTGVCG